MKEMRGQADAGRVRELILEKLQPHVRFPHDDPPVRPAAVASGVDMLREHNSIDHARRGEAGPSPALTRNRRHPAPPGASRNACCDASSSHRCRG